MKMTIDAGIFLLLISITLLAGVLLGINSGMNAMEKKAIEAGVAKMVVANPTDKKTTFTFITNSVEKLP